MTEGEAHAIAVVGGAAAGAEAAGIFASRGILTVVIEQNARPYGKIEDGLPRWHVALREKEYRTIDQKLDQPHVHFVPRTRLGRDIDLRELTEGWGFHAIVLANGAWRDRPLPLEDADRWIGRGLVYQNPFIYGFNHAHEPGFAGERYEIRDGTIVVGGGLASIDVAKVVQFELTLEALRQRGIEADLVELEVKGIPRVLAAHGLTWEALGLRGCTLYYRRRPQDMPLVSLPENATPAQQEKVAKSRARVLEKATEKYLFRVEPLHAPVDLIIENERLVGLEFARTRVEGGRVERTDARVPVRAPLTISSIGSIPEPLPGIAMKGELYAFEDWELGRLPRFPTLFSAGNVVTGKGNIVDSRRHARKVASHVTERYLALADAVQTRPPLDPARRRSLLERIRKHQERAGYEGDYSRWIARVSPGG
ncbi:MAG: hypothetical protein ACE5FG_00655 [Myxococcota bacterium]